MMQQCSDAVIQPLHPGLEALEDGFCMLDAAWRITYWNPAAERMLRAPRGKLLGRVLWDVFPHLRRASSWENLQRAAAERSPRRYLDQYPPGTSRGFVSVYAAPVQEGLAVHFRDATEEVKRAEEYSGLLESIQDGFVAVDESWRITYMNAAAESLLRFSRDQVRGLTLWSVIPREPGEIGECLRATMADGIKRHLREVRPVGRVFRGRVYDLWTYPLADGGISILFEDVTERLRREKELARLAAEAQEANRAKSRFFAAISHELRTPLNAIVGYTHLLGTQTYGAMPKEAERAAVRAGVCAEHLARLVDDVLLLTATEAGRLPVIPATVRIPEFLATMLEPQRHQAEAKGLRFVIDAPADLPPLETDPQRLRQLLVALVSNAIKFTSTGEVRVEVRLNSGGDPTVEETEEYSLFPEREVEFHVTDTGSGIAPEDRERIFGPFEQVGDPARSQTMLRGTGLGLTIARQLSNLLHGSLFLAETSERGSQFCLRLPIAFFREAVGGRR